MTDIIKSVLTIYRDYAGASAYMIIALVALVYLFVTEKDKTVKMALIYVSMGLLVLFFIPVYAYVVIEFFLEYEVYYRMLWFVPYAALVAYAGVRLLMRTLGLIRRVVLVVLFAAMLLGTGSCVFTDGTYKRAENAYHVPQVVIDIVDMIKIGDCTNICAFPPEIVQYIRQVDPDIVLCYGREMLVPRWGYVNPVYAEMAAPEYDIWKIQSEARRQQVTCIVLDNRKKAEGDLRNELYAYLGTAGCYDVYVDESFYDTYYKDYLSEGK